MYFKEVGPPSALEVKWSLRGWVVCVYSSWAVFWHWSIGGFGTNWADQREGSGRYHV